jgi:hypothetical protein
LKDLGADERVILKWMLKIRWDNVNWICLAKHRDQEQAFVNTVMNIWVPEYLSDYKFLKNNSVSWS